MPSDRHLVHWIYFLETDPTVKFFELEAESSLAGGRYWAVVVQFMSGTRAIHQIGHRQAERNGDIAPSDSDALSAEASSMKRRIFSDEELQPVVKTSLRWLKPIAFAAALRDQEYTCQTLLLLEHFKQQTSGDIGRVLGAAEVCEHEPAIILGLIVRLCIKGHIRLDLTAQGFGHRTPWSFPC